MLRRLAEARFWWFALGVLVIGAQTPATTMLRMDARGKGLGAGANGNPTRTDASDGDIDLDDYARLWGCLSGPSLTPDQACGMPGGRAGPPPSGTFTLHGRPADILSDGHTLLDFRARLYDPAIGRWLQRDPLRYNDGPSLYEAFQSNAMRFSDPFGRQTEEPGLLESLVEFFHRFQTGADPFTGENLIDKALRRAGAVGESNPYRRAFLEGLDLYEDVTFATIQAAEPVVARGVGVVQVVGGVAEAGTGVVLVVVSKGLGAAPGTIFALHGADVTQSGVRQVISGRFTPTETYTVIAGVGYPTTALGVDVGISLGSGFAGIGAVDELIAVPSRITTAGTLRGSRFLDYAGRGQQRLAAVLFDARPGEVVLGTGLSPGPIGVSDVGGRITVVARTLEQPRNALGRFAPKLGSELRPGSLAESTVEAGIKAKPGYRVIGRQIYVRDPAMRQVRVVDFVVETRGGRFVGIEVKSGRGRRSLYQSRFDRALNAADEPFPTFGRNVPSELPGLEIRRVVLIEVP